MAEMRQILFVLACFVIVLTCDAHPAVYDAAVKTPFQLNEYLTGEFSPKSFNASWLTENSLLYKTKNGDYNLFDASTKTAELFLPKSKLENYSGASIKVSPDGKYVLITYNVSSIFRHSTVAIFTVYDIQNDNYYDLHEKEPLQLATWSPEGQALVYVYKNNIFYVDSPENAANFKQITGDGIVGIIYNGVPDWVYEEEVLGSGSALWFSPDGKYLAYASFDDRGVADFYYSIYGVPGNPENLYPHIAALKYPKVGTPNPAVKISVVDLTSEMSPPNEIPAIPEQFLDEDYVLYDVTWPTNNEISVIVTNRVQNKGQLSRCTIEGECKVETTYEETKGWLNPRIPKYNKDGSKCVEISPQPEGDDFFDHVVLHDVTNSESRRLTNGKKVVSKIIGWDENNKKVYFAATVENFPSRQQVYSVDTETTLEECVTCNMSTLVGECTYADMTFSKDFSYNVKICGGPGPIFAVVKNTADNKDAVIWEDNKDLLEKLLTKEQPIVRDYIVNTSTKFKARARAYLPPDYDDKCSKLYPAIVQVYGGPDSNKISDRYTADLRQYLTTNRGYIYINIDARGSGLDGQNKMFEVYRKLGTAEIADQIEVTKTLQNNICIDSKKTGIWGWSYGGFASAMVLAKDNEKVFKFAVSVAPVTNFMFYDTIYTERYMGLPTKEDNELGYNNTDISRQVEGFRGKNFFLIHGNGDDNVHYQQSMILSKALELADIQFRQMSYPDETHSLQHVTPHLYHTLDRYFATQFDLPPPPIVPFSPPRKHQKEQ